MWGKFIAINEIIIKKNAFNQYTIDYEVITSGKPYVGTAIGKPVENLPKPVEFDWHDGQTLIDAKDWNSGGIFDSSVSHPYLPEDRQGELQILQMATHQIEALETTNGEYTKIEWRVADENILNCINNLFEENGLENLISAKYYPKPK